MNMVLSKMLENMLEHRIKTGFQYWPTAEEWEAIRAHRCCLETSPEILDGMVLFHGVWVRLADQSRAQREKIVGSPHSVFDPYLWRRR